MVKKIKNNTGSNKTIRGRVVAPGQYIEIPEYELILFLEDATISGDLTSGDLIMNDGTTDITGSTEGLALINYRADAMNISFQNSGTTLVANDVEAAIKEISLSAGVSSDLSALVTERTTTLVLNGTPTEIGFDVTGLENDISVLEHNNTNTERLDIKTSGLHQVAISLTVENLATQDKVLDLELRVNGTPVKNISINLDKTSQETFTRITQVSLNAGTYITFAASQNGGGTDLTIQPVTVASIVKMRGQQGEPGPAGPAGDITWEGTWVSQPYVTNQAVHYAGRAYVCHTNTTANQVPTDTGYWDILAEKGDVGAGQNRIDIPTHHHSNWYKSTALATYTRTNGFLFAGSTLMGVPTKIYANAWMAAGSGNVRLYDVTNSLVIAESASITSTSEGNIVDLGTISNVPTGQAVFVIEHKGDGTNTNDIGSLSIEF